MDVDVVNSTIGDGYLTETNSMFVRPNKRDTKVISANKFTILISLF